MCFCCCGCCCNSQSSKCIEISILLVSIINLLSPTLILVFIKLNHISLATKIFLIIVIVFCFLNLISIIVILVWRSKAVINTTKNSAGLCFTRVGLVLCILSFLVSIILEAIIKSNLTQLDYPCNDFVYGISNITSGEEGDIIWFRYLSNEGFTEKEKEFCQSVKDNDYYSNICSNIEYIITYISTSFIQLCTIILSFLWYNDGRRVSAKVDGALGNRTTFGGRGSVYGGAPNMYNGGQFGQQYGGIGVYSQGNGISPQLVGINGNLVMNMNFGRRRNTVINYARCNRNAAFNSVNEDVVNVSDNSKNISDHKKISSRNNDNISERSKGSIENFSSTKLRRVKKKKKRKSRVKISSNNVVFKEITRNKKHKKSDRIENIENISEGKNENESKEKKISNKINSPVKEEIAENEVNTDIDKNSESNKSKNNKNENNIKKLYINESNLKLSKEKNEFHN